MHGNEREALDAVDDSPASNEDESRPRTESRESSHSASRCVGSGSDQTEIEPEPVTQMTPRGTAETLPRQNHSRAAADNTSRRQRKSSSEEVGESAQWQELAAEAAGAEIEALHLQQAGSFANAAERYRDVIAKLREAAKGVENKEIAQLLEKRADEPFNETQLHLATQGILASSLATTAGQPDASSHRTKMLGTAAAIGGATGLLLAGPLSAASLGVAAAYATTREDNAGVAARKVSTMGMGVADRAVDASLKVADLALEEGRKRLLEGLDGTAPGKFGELCYVHKDKCQRAVAAVEALQGSLPRRKLCEEAKRMRARYPDRVPVLCERAPASNLPDIARKKFAVPGSMRCSEFKYIVYKQVALSAGAGLAEQTIYVFVGGTSPKTSATMADLYAQHGSDDGFLYVQYCAENTLGALTV
jgi:GABA(A) receptor-associated protein